MSIITRPVKEGSVLTYAAKVAAGYPNILDTEMDADFAAIFDAWNAGVDPVNIKTDAVETLKIKDLNVTTGKLAALAVTAPKLATDAVETAKIKDLNVTRPKLAVQASTNAYQSAGVTTGLTISGGDVTETDLVTLPSITVRGGYLRVGGVIMLDYSPPLLEETITIRVYRDTTVILTVQLVVLYGASSVTSVPLPIPIDRMETPTSGSYVYKVTAQKYQTASPTTSTIQVRTPPANAGIVYAEERA